MQFIKLLLLILTLFVMYSCKKDSQHQAIPIVPTPAVEARFSVKKDCFNTSLPDSVQVIDSLIKLVNTSDTGSKVSYKWDLGDNSSSTSKDVSHIYILPGIYKIQLVTYYNALPSDTAYANIRIVIGQKKFKTLKYNTLLDAAITQDNGVMAIESAYNNPNDQPSYSIILTDSLLKQQWIKTLGTTSRLSSIDKTSTDEYIVSGNYLAGNVSQFSVSKLSSAGDHLWTKFITGLSGTNVSTIETADKGFITIGTVGPNPQYMAIVKLDVNGDEVWRKTFDNPSPSLNLKNASNILEADNSFLFAAISSSQSNLFLTRISQSGEVTKQSMIPISSSTGTASGAGVAKTSAGYLVNILNSSVGYLFDNNFTPINFKTIGQSSVNSLISWNDNYYTAEGSFQYAFINRLDTNAVPVWNYLIHNEILVTCGSVLNGASRFGRKIKKGRNDFVSLSDGQDDPNGFLSSSIYIERLSLTGLIR